MGKLMNVIPTEYKGYRFRSRLEARWAVFFDAMGVKWEYEPEGFKLSNGMYYLPDFYLPDQKLWIEVKGVTSTVDEDKVTAFFREEGENVSHEIVMVGEIPPKTDDVVQWAYDTFKGRDYYMYGFVDFPYLPCVCPTCGKFGFEFDGRGARICKHDKLDDKGYTADHPRIQAAYAAARKARFEHGETPTIPTAEDYINKKFAVDKKFVYRLIDDVRRAMIAKEDVEEVLATYEKEL